MGDWYEIIHLAEVYYLQYCSEETEGRAVSIKLTKEQVEKADILERELCAKRQDLLKSFISK
jgi:hypothetical protein